MTTENMISHICRMLQDYDLHTGSRAADLVISDPARWLRECPDGAFPFYDSAAEMLLSCREKLSAKTTPTSALNACKRIIRSSNRKDMQGVFSEDGFSCVCDGYRLVRLKADLPSLPHVKTDFKASKALPKEAGREIKLPTIPELKSWIAERKAKIPGPWKPRENAYILTDGDFRMGVNPQYLLDMLQIFPVSTARYTTAVSPLYFSSENGDGVLLPVRLTPPKREEAAA